MHAHMRSFIWYHELSTRFWEYRDGQGEGAKRAGRREERRGFGLGVLYERRKKEMETNILLTSKLPVGQDTDTVSVTRCVTV